jgi:hypothetical protein
VKVLCYKHLSTETVRVRNRGVVRILSLESSSMRLPTQHCGHSSATMRSRPSHLRLREYLRSIPKAYCFWSSVENTGVYLRERSRRRRCESWAFSNYNSFVRRESAIDRAKQNDSVERARRMTPEHRLLACVNISSVVLELARIGKRDREEKLRRPRR